MSRRLPPLNSLRAFEAAGRHLSLSRAAVELNVTPAAVSHQVKALEEYLGVALFRRVRKGLLLTDAGQACLPGLREGFDRLARAVQDLRAYDAHRPLTVSAAPSFAAKWLVPRVDRFRRAHPDIELRIDASAELVDFGRDEVDVAIRYGPGGYTGMHVERLFPEVMCPVCSPRLLQGPHPLRTPGDLRFHTLLHVDWPRQEETWADWKMWLRSAGENDVDASRGPRYSISSMAVQAAIEGHGVALASNILVADDIAAGRLLNPFEMCLPADFAYYLVCPDGSVELTRVAAFREWVIGEARALGGGVSGSVGSETNS